MKQFTTITEKEILYHAYHAILDKYFKEKDRYDRNHNELTLAWLKKLNAQEVEIHNRILELEAEEN